MTVSETHPFWGSALERIKAPPARSYVFHTLNPESADKIGCSVAQLASFVSANGLFAPKDYSVLTLRFGMDWVKNVNGHPPTDFIYYTPSVPTSESQGIIRDSLVHGLPMRDPVLEAAEVPETVRLLFPDASEFVRVPPEDLQTIIRWESTAQRGDFVGAVNCILQTAPESGDWDTAALSIVSVLKQAPFDNSRDCLMDDVLLTIARNNIEVHKRQQLFQHMWNAYIGFTG